jgi:tetratricopeptide (TPR) repeat protein
MVYLVHGDESLEMFECHRDLGCFYGETDRPESAVRHFRAAQRLENKLQIPESDTLDIALRVAECCLKIDTKRKQHITAAETEIQRFDGREPEDEATKTRLTIVRAKVFKEKGEFEKSIENYEAALAAIEAADEQTAKLFVEAGEVCENLADFERAIAKYQAARDLFERLQMTDVVAGLDAKIHAIEMFAMEEEEKHDPE